MGDNPMMRRCRKNVGAVSTVDEKGRVVTAVISSGARDRMGDVVSPDGVDLTEYARNPVVCLQHDVARMPIATSQRPDGTLAVWREGNRLKAEAHFHLKTAESVQAFELARLGVLRGASIGFQPLSEPEPLPPDAAGRAGLRFRSWALSEWSLVTMPANAECVVVAKDLLSRGRLCGEALTPSITKSLQRAIRMKRRDDDPLDKYRLSNDKPGATPGDEDGNGELDLYDRIQAEDEANIEEFVSGRHPEPPGRAAGLAGRPGGPAINLDNLSLLGVQVLADVCRQITEAIDQAVSKLETRPAAAQKFLRLRTSGEGYGAVSKAEQAARRLLASVRKLRRAGRPVELKSQPTAAEIKEAVGAAVAGVAPIVQQLEQMIRRRLGR